MIVNSKIALAFAAGALLASGIVYVALKPSVRPPHVEAAASPAPAPKPDSAEAPPAAEPVSARAPAPPVVDSKPPKSAGSKSLSEARPPVKTPKNSGTPPVQMARVTSPPDTAPPPGAAPAPAPEVIEPPAPTPEAAPPQEPVSAPDPVNEAPPTPAPPPVNQVTLQPGTVITVRLAETLSSDKNVKGDTFFATLDQPLVAGGFAIAERGARVEGHVVDAIPGGRGGTTAHLSLSLTRVHTSDGQHVVIETTAFDKKGESSSGENAAKIGGGAVLGAIIGAAVGGGKGAAIGAGAGGAAGAGGTMLSHGHAATLPTETRLTFRLQQAVTITERAP